MKRYLVLVVATLFLFGVAHVSVFGSGQEEEAAAADVPDDWPDVVNIGVLPEEDHAVLFERYESFEEHFQEHLGVPVQMYFADSFTGVIEAMRQGHVDVSKFGPFAYILASERADAVAFRQGVLNADEPTYKSYIIAREDSGIDSVEDLEGVDFGWVDPASTSGYLFPAAHLIQEAGLDGQEDFEEFFGNVVNTGGHDASVRNVISGDLDAAAASDSQVIRMQRADYEGIEDIKIVTETDPIPRSPEAYRADLPESLVEALDEAYATFDDEEFLTAHNYDDGFISVEDAAYDVVRNTARALDLDPEELF